MMVRQQDNSPNYLCGATTFQMFVAIQAVHAHFSVAYNQSSASVS